MHTTGKRFTVPLEHQKARTAPREESTLKVVGSRSNSSSGGMPALLPPEMVEEKKARLLRTIRDRIAGSRRAKG